MSTEDNKALVRRFYEEVFNQRNLALVDELCTTTHMFHNPPTTLHGREEFKQLLSLYTRAFPDARFTIEDQIAEGNMVASRYTFHGTHRGELMGIAPTGKQVTRTMIQIFHLRDGKLLEEWVEGESLRQQ